ncbi:asparagine synthase (glutamine-hydrolyzing) [Pseudoalteromonas piscicida]|uniref:asparagine synthase (glutamine-hydrolyzing) n=1 Tax=Pseudoalteromonas piscicida TaxID=43662 RepID=A0A2A5JW27_PSEO7|nr:asparagine synthase (glutamine-hydrolyzing) [Pseudoalteromonas piscicida]PCK33610.1 asparagine synthase (glutamine-hydrolyzing) [Pseudoalteromonas piscicida]
MCGIAGMVAARFEPVSNLAIKNMTDSIVHRGPDGEGIWVEGNVGLGHRRLSILDLSSAGHQPMMSSDTRYIMSYNGEIYNFRELRADLERLGYTFRSQTDSEVLLNAFHAWGTDCLLKFNGMFSVAIWDRVEKQLFLARDRYGVKPLYYSQNGKGFFFGSEIKAILTHPDVKAEMNKEALVEYFTFQNFITENTLHKNINILPAGHYLFVNVNAEKVSAPIQYWDYDFQEPEHALGEQEYIEELDRLMVQAVNRQLVSDVEVGSYLSGGMDSGTLTALAARQLPYMKSYTVGFDLSSASGIEMSYDERAKAEHMSYAFKTEHYEMVLKAGDMERCMSDLVWHLEEPRVGQSYPNFYAAKLASKFGKVVLSGAGGDELFAGYPWRYYRAVVNDDFEHYIDKYYSFWQRLINNQDQQKVFAPIKGDIQNVWTRDIMSNAFKHHAKHLTKPEDYINHSLYFEAKTFLHGLFVVEDKLSMAHSLESRVPFMDNDLVDFAMKVPARLKLGNLDKVVNVDENEIQKFFQRTKDGKLLLRKAMEKYIPTEVTKREKQGFSSPDATWFKGESIDYVRDKILSKNAAIYQYMDYDEVSRLVNQHLSGQKNRRLLIWSLLNVEEWCNKFI